MLAMSVSSIFCSRKAIDTPHCVNINEALEAQCGRYLLFIYGNVLLFFRSCETFVLAKCVRMVTLGSVRNKPTKLRTTRENDCVLGPRCAKPPAGNPGLFRITK